MSSPENIKSNQRSHNELFIFYQILEMQLLQNDSQSICHFTKYHLDQYSQKKRNMIYIIIFSFPSSSIPTYLTGWLNNYQFELSTRQCVSGQITSNILAQASKRSYEIRQPPTCLCTTSSFLTNVMVLMVSMVIVVAMAITVKMVIMVLMVIMTLGARTTRQETGQKGQPGKPDRKRDRQDRQIWQLNLTF